MMLNSVIEEDLKYILADKNVDECRYCAKSGIAHLLHSFVEEPRFVNATRKLVGLKNKIKFQTITEKFFWRI
jgi:hypothetical protein